MTFSIDGKVVDSVNLVAQDSIDKINIVTMIKKVVYSWIDLLRS